MKMLIMPEVSESDPRKLRADRQKVGFLVRSRNYGTGRPSQLFGSTAGQAAVAIVAR
jgi:hypothetical protein